MTYPRFIFAQNFSMRKITVVLSVLSLILFGCSPNNVIEDNAIKKYFDEQNVTGTFGQFDNTRGEFTIYNLARFADTAFLPGGTFDIVNGIIALEAGVLPNDTNTININSNLRPTFAVESPCDTGLTLRAAFRSN